MPSGGAHDLFLAITARPIHMAPGIIVYGYVAQAILQLWVTEDTGHFIRFPFQLDTKTDVTTVPEAWVINNPGRFGPLSRRITAGIHTAAGKVDCAGRMALGVRFQLPGEKAEGRMNVLVSATLKTNYGLLSLHDLHNHYLVRTEGPFRLDGDKPLTLGRLRLERRKVR